VGTDERLRQVRERLLLEGTVRPVAIGPREGRALREWVRREGALRTLETGLGYASSTLFICEGLLANGADGMHVAIDPHQLDSPPGHRTRYSGGGLRTLEEAGIRHLVEFHAEGSEIVLPRLVAEQRSFDFAFLDGNHRFEGVLLDLIYAGRLLPEGGVVFVDDHQLPAVRRAVRFCLANLGWSGEEDGREGEHEWVVLRTGSHEAFRRPYDSFVDF
jgi:predicted O-methyltransferase YrrM